MLVYTPIAPPPLPQDATKPAELADNQAKMHAEVLAHFSKPDYTLPGVDKGELREEELFWLVRVFL